MRYPLRRPTRKSNNFWGEYFDLLRKHWTTESLNVFFELFWFIWIQKRWRRFRPIANTGKKFDYKKILQKRGNYSFSVADLQFKKAFKVIERDVHLNFTSLFELIFDCFINMAGRINGRWWRLMTFFRYGILMVLTETFNCLIASNSQSSVLLRC